MFALFCHENPEVVTQKGPLSNILKSIPTTGHTAIFSPKWMFSPVEQFWRLAAASFLGLPRHFHCDLHSYKENTRG